jgi:hypothetical protein
MVGFAHETRIAARFEPCRVALDVRPTSIASKVNYKSKAQIIGITIIIISARFLRRACVATSSRCSLRPSSAGAGQDPVRLAPTAAPHRTRAQPNDRLALVDTAGSKAIIHREQIPETSRSVSWWVMSS